MNTLTRRLAGLTAPALACAAVLAAGTAHAATPALTLNTLHASTSTSGPKLDITYTCDQGTTARLDITAAPRNNWLSKSLDYFADPGSPATLVPTGRADLSCTGEPVTTTITLTGEAGEGDRFTVTGNLFVSETGTTTGVGGTTAVRSMTVVA